MVLMLIGCALLAMAWMRGGRVVSGALLCTTAVALLVVSIVPPPPAEVSYLVDELGRIVGAHSPGPTRAWFGTDPRTFVPAALFGLAWTLVGMGQLRRILDRPLASA